MLLPTRRHVGGSGMPALAARQSSLDPGDPTTTSPDQGHKTTIVVRIIPLSPLIAIVVVVVLAAIVVLYVTTKACRSQRGKSQSSTGTGNGLLKRIGRWRSGSNRGEYSSQLQPTITRGSGHSGDDTLSRARSAGQNGDVEMELAGRSQPQPPPAAASATAGVDRNTSVRSVMTLPAYSPAARPTEQVLGREGERAGVDVVVEYPEEPDEEEVRRDEEMESLYQIRRARRQEAAEREERRRLRREARARGDAQAVSRLQEEGRQRAAAAAEGTLLSAQLIAEHQTKPRERRVSAVNYFDVGLARHDGSRIRGASIDSDNRPLLSSAASLSGASIGPNSIPASVHHRGRSSSSVVSVSTNASDDDALAVRASGDGSGGTSGAGDFEVVSLDNRSRSPSISPSFSSPAEGDVAGHGVPHDQPPHYDNLGWEDAPAYESPVMRTAPRLPSLTALPSIEITAAMSPIDRSPTIPRDTPRS